MKLHVRVELSHDQDWIILILVLVFFSSLESVFPHFQSSMAYYHCELLYSCHSYCLWGCARVCQSLIPEKLQTIYKHCPSYIPFLCFLLLDIFMWISSHLFPFERVQNGSSCSLSLSPSYSLPQWINQSYIFINLFLSTIC